MAWQIERIGVKNGGLFASWGYNVIMVDENGNIYSMDAPGSDGFNLSVSQYKKNDRRYYAGQLIAEFCNLDTFTNYRIYAQDQTPYARAETDINAPKCGYQEPLPEPAVPPNPFGNPVYGAYRTFDFCDENLIPVFVTIECKNYDGPVFPIEIGGKSPVVLSYIEVEDKFEPIRASECNLSFIVNENFVLEEFYSSDERTFRVTVTKNNIIRFKGYIIPDSCAEPFNSPPYEVTIRATDSIGGLKSVSYPIPVGSTTDISQPFVNVLAYCFAMTNLNLNISTICNLYESSMPTGSDNDPMLLASINPLRLSEDNGTVMTVYDVLEHIARSWGAYIVQANGSWNFVRINELSNNVIRQRTYNYKGLFLRSENFMSNRKAGYIK